LTGLDGRLKQLTKTALETALNEELTEHLGYDEHDPAGEARCWLSFRPWAAAGIQASGAAAAQRMVRPPTVLGRTLR